VNGGDDRPMTIGAARLRCERKPVLRTAYTRSRRGQGIL